MLVYNDVLMLSEDTSEIEINNYIVNYSQNFVLDWFSFPLARNLAVAVFMDQRPEPVEIEEVRNKEQTHNEGSIITGSPGISQKVKSKDKTGNLKSLLISKWRNFISMFSGIRKKLIYRFSHKSG